MGFGFMVAHHEIELRKGEIKMSPGVIFVQGMVGVFFGMALIYLSIKITAKAIEWSSGRQRGEQLK